MGFEVLFSISLDTSLQGLHQIWGSSILCFKPQGVTGSKMWRDAPYFLPKGSRHILLSLFDRVAYRFALSNACVMAW